MENRPLDCMEGNLSPKEVELYNILRRLWMDHAIWTRGFTISTAFNSEDLDDVTKRLLRNPTDFAYLLSIFFGNQYAMEFEELLRDHLLIAGQLVNAAKDGDTKTVNEQREKWYQNATDIAVLLGDMSPYWNTQAWQAMLNDHLKMVENQATQILTGKYQESIDQYDNMQTQMLMMADQMACGIIKQFNI
ncbi:acetylglutamate kinase [Clostridium aminobutyricum]|uniref:Acetylglutamate kinase n=1 Tax=Clostridium aminobutyricum TaxID=33953 RepID=A0A939D8B3_CLOAM|nr:acetylglutamate kinase [Clostridium aminobutyricum]MBN7772965.1 acetylglutamate kinase [Clostridium aminobutyricum]